MRLSACLVLASLAFAAPLALAQTAPAAVAPAAPATAAAAPQAARMRFTGRLSALNLSCQQQGGTCRATINGIGVVLGQSVVGAKTAWGKFDVASSGIGGQYQVYCHKIDDKLCTLQGQSDYFVRPATAKARK